MAKSVILCNVACKSTGQMISNLKVNWNVFILIELKLIFSKVELKQKFIDSYVFHPTDNTGRNDSIAKCKYNARHEYLPYSGT